MTTSASTSDAEPVVFGPVPSIDAVTFARLVEKEEERFRDCLVRLVRNGVGDKAGAAELTAITSRYDTLAMIQRGYLS